MAWVTLVISCDTKCLQGQKIWLCSPKFLPASDKTARLCSVHLIVMPCLTSTILRISRSDLFIVCEVDSYSQGAAGTVNTPRRDAEPHKAHLSSLTSKSRSLFIQFHVYSIYHSPDCSPFSLLSPWILPSGIRKLDPYLCKQDTSQRKANLASTTNEDLVFQRICLPSASCKARRICALLRQETSPRQFVFQHIAHVIQFKRLQT